jgi:hypothetical protein
MLALPDSLTRISGLKCFDSRRAPASLTERTQIIRSCGVKVMEGCWWQCFPWHEGSSCSRKQGGESLLLFGRGYLSLNHIEHYLNAAERPSTE